MTTATTTKKKTLPEIFGHNVWQWRVYRDMTQGQIAELCGMRQSQISQIEWGKSEFSSATISRLAKALKCRPIDLLVAEGCEVK